MTLAKALANGVPIGAMLATESVASAFTPGTHGSTFGGNPFVTAVGLTVFTTLMEERLPERAAATGSVLQSQLEAVRARHPKAATAVRGQGLPRRHGPGAAGGRGDRGLPRAGPARAERGRQHVCGWRRRLVTDEATVRRAVEIIDQVLGGFVK